MCKQELNESVGCSCLLKALTVVIQPGKHMQAPLPGLGNIQPSPSYTQTHKHRCKQSGSSLGQWMYLSHRPQILKGGALLLPVFCSLFLASPWMAVAQNSRALRNKRPREDYPQRRWEGIKALGCWLWHLCFEDLP